MVTTMRRRWHHGRRSIATVSVRVATHLVDGASTNSRERASEASSSALEVGKATRGASPVTGTRAVLAWGERSQDILSAVEDAARRWRDLDGLFVQGTTVHAETLSSLLMGREYRKSSAGRLMLFRGTKSPESNGSATKLGEPAFELGLSRIVRQSRHVKHLAPLREEGSHIGSGIHGSSQYVGMLLGRLRLADQTTKNTGEGNGLLHRSTGRGGGKSL
jgi:hypothetical protein